MFVLFFFSGRVFFVLFCFSLSPVYTQLFCLHPCFLVVIFIVCLQCFLANRGESVSMQISNMCTNCAVSRFLLHYEAI